MMITKKYSDLNLGEIMALKREGKDPKSLLKSMRTPVEVERKTNKKDYVFNVDKIGTQTKIMFKKIGGLKGLKDIINTLKKDPTPRQKHILIERYKISMTFINTVIKKEAEYIEKYTRFAKLLKK